MTVSRACLASLVIALGLTSSLARADDGKITTPELSLTIRKNEASGGGGLHKLKLAGEVADASVDDFGYRSMRSDVDIDCAKRRDRVTAMTVFQGAGGSGEAHVVKVPGGWAEPAPEAYLGKVIARVCGVGAAPVTAGLVPTPPPVQTSAPAPTPTPAKAAPTAPAMEHDGPPPKIVAGITKPGHIGVQLSASDTAEGAQKVLDKLPKTLARHLTKVVDTRKVGDRTFYRAVVNGFQTPADGRAFCAENNIAPKDCFVR